MRCFQWMTAHAKNHIPKKMQSSKHTMSSCDYDPSVHSASISEVYDVPMTVITRPLQPVQLDENKVRSLMKALQDPEKSQQVAPIDVLWLQGSQGGDYYFSFGGCHRFAAHQRLRRQTVRAKLVRSTIEDLRCYLGASTPQNLK